MAIIHPEFLDYVVTVLRSSISSATLPFHYDPLLQLAQHCVKSTEGELSPPHGDFSETLIDSAKENIARIGILGSASAFFRNPILIQSLEPEVERMVIALKRGYPRLPSTKMSTIVQGFGYTLGSSDILSIYASYGLARKIKDLAEQYDFVDLNRRIDRLSVLLSSSSIEEPQKVHRRYMAIRSYVMSSPRKKNKAIRASGLGRGLFFYYWKSFKQYGLLGLVDRGKKIFRESKVGLENEAKMVVDKLQHSDRKTSYYVELLKHKGIEVERSTVSRIFSRWGTKQYKSVFVSNLERLEREPKAEELLPRYEVPVQVPIRMVDTNILSVLAGMGMNEMYVSAPGIFALWVYLEELAIFPVLDSMDLAGGDRGYDWFDLLLLNIGRIFYGIPCYSRTCKHEEPTLAFFCHLVSLPCNDTFLKGLASISPDQVFGLQKWLIKRSHELGLINGRRLAFDFHQIDLDVEMDRLRQFGKGPSPKKKVCYNGFRPHIVWDLDTGNLVVAEFRKSSARGTTTVKRFVKDFLLKPFRELFHEIYLDSEYTGKDVWNFILEKEIGMGAQLVACIKQNPMVRKARDAFLLKNRNQKNFWVYYDDEHVYSAITFPLSWEYRNSKSSDKKTLTLDCVVKKNTRNGKLRCFGTSKTGMASESILSDYSRRWAIENGIKDLIHSYFMDKCPGTSPHLVNVHFLIVTICRQIYRMIQRDLGDFIKNADGSVKSLATMRDSLFRQGSSRVMFREEGYEVKFSNSYSPELTQELNRWFELLEKRCKAGLNILGGSRLKFYLQSPHGEEHRNALRRRPLNLEKISLGGKI
jgi:hypothetical protein